MGRIRLTEHPWLTQCAVLACITPMICPAFSIPLSVHHPCLMNLQGSGDLCFLAFAAVANSCFLTLPSLLFLDTGSQRRNAQGLWQFSSLLMG